MSKTYEITAINKRSIVDSAGHFKNVYEINFETTAGVRDNVEVPEADYNPEHVKELLNNLAAIHDEIMTQD